MLRVRQMFFDRSPNRIAKFSAKVTRTRMWNYKIVYLINTRMMEDVFLVLFCLSTEVISPQ